MVSKLSGRFQNWYFWMAYKSSRRLNISRWPHPFQSASGHFQILSKHLSQSQSYSNISIWFHMIKLLGYFPMISNFQAGRFHNFQDGSSLFQNFPNIFKTVSNLLKIYAEQVFNEEYVLSFSSRKMTISWATITPFLGLSLRPERFCAWKVATRKVLGFCASDPDTTKHQQTLLDTSVLRVKGGWLKVWGGRLITIRPGWLLEFLAMLTAKKLKDKEQE